MPVGHQHLLGAWVLVRYTFPGKRFIDALVDFPFALPTAVAGLTLSNLFAANGWLGQYLVPFGISQALGERAGGNSLDNTIRVARRVPTEWLLLDVRIHAVAHGFGHGLVHMWAEDGSLLATASQSAIVRRWKEHPS